MNSAQTELFAAPIDVQRERTLLIHMARVHIAALQARRHHPTWRHFWWTIFDWAQQCRRDAAALKETPQ